MPVNPDLKAKFKKFGLKLKEKTGPTLQRVESLDDLTTVLATASELEQSLLLQYLYAAATLKVLPGELPPDALAKAQAWEKTILNVAVQEMFHLAAVLNIHVALSIPPHVDRPNFATDADHYPLSINFELLPFSLYTIERFICYERPAQPVTDGAYADPFCHACKAPDAIVQGPSFNIMEIYETLRAAFNDPVTGKPPGLKDLVFNGVAQEVTEFKHAWDWGKITDRASAQKAIDVICEEGEGSTTDRADCHFGAFCTIRNELETIVGKKRSDEDPANPKVTRLTDAQKDGLKAIPASTQFAFSTLKSPMVTLAAEADPNLVTIIDPTNVWAIQVMNFFNNIYDMLVLCLAGAWTLVPQVKSVMTCAIMIMHKAVAPISQILCRTRAWGYIGAGDRRKMVEGTAGPSYYLSDEARAYVTNPDALTLDYLRSKLTSLIAEGKDLASRADAYNDLWNAVINDQNGLPSFLSYLADPPTAIPVVAQSYVPQPTASLATTAKSRSYLVAGHVIYEGIVDAHPRFRIPVNAGSNDTTGSVGRGVIRNRATGGVARIFGVAKWCEDSKWLLIWPTYNARYYTPAMLTAIEAIATPGATIDITVD